MITHIIKQADKANSSARPLNVCQPWGSTPDTLLSSATALLVASPLTLPFWISASGKVTATSVPPTMLTTLPLNTPSGHCASLTGHLTATPN